MNAKRSSSFTNSIRPPPHNKFVPGPYIIDTALDRLFQDPYSFDGEWHQLNAGIQLPRDVPCPAVLSKSQIWHSVPRDEITSLNISCWSRSRVIFMTRVISCSAERPSRASSSDILFRRRPSLNLYSQFTVYNVSYNKYAA